MRWVSHKRSLGLARKFASLIATECERNNPMHDQCTGPILFQIGFVRNCLAPPPTPSHPSLVAFRNGANPLDQWRIGVRT
jgi:hypothetical protein